MSDILIRGNSMDGAIRIFVAVTTELVEEARRIHKSYPTSTAALGRVLTMAAIMGADLKNETDSVTIRVSGDGPLGTIVAVTDNESKVRGYAVNPFVDIPSRNGKLDVGGAIGSGDLTVIKDLSMKEPYAGQVPLVTGEIAEDMTYYFAKSEQIPTAIGLGVLVDTDNSVITAGGFMLQLMPEASEELAAELEDKLRTLPPVTKMLTDGMTAEEILLSVCDGYSMLYDMGRHPEYKCKCTKSRMEKSLISIGKTELEGIISEQGEAELTCQFCDNVYKFNKEELEALLEKAK